MFKSGSNFGLIVPDSDFDQNLCCSVFKYVPSLSSENLDPFEHQLGPRIVGFLGP